MDDYEVSMMTKQIAQVFRKLFQEEYQGWWIQPQGTFLLPDFGRLTAVEL